MLGPAAWDERHRLVGSGSVAILDDLSLSGKAIYSSAKPYTALTGTDDNLDGEPQGPNDIPAGEGRNARRGPDYFRADLSIAWNPVLVGGRNVGLMLTMMILGRIAQHLDPRMLIGGGFSLLAISSWAMAGWSLDVGHFEVIWTGFVQGVGAGVGAYGIRQLGKTLVVPMRDTAGRVHSLQFIGADGGKRFLRGGRAKGLFHTIGERTSRIWLCEGYATAVSVFEHFSERTVACFTAGNLLAVGQALKAAGAESVVVV